MPHLAAFEDVALVVEVEVDVGILEGTGDAQQAGRRAARPLPSRLTIAVGESAAVDPRPSPQMARMCCSNCEVTAPSIVQWPELWTRGASSLTTSEPSGSRNNSAVRVPHRSIASARAHPIAAARDATLAATGAGATDSNRIPASCRFREIGKVATAPSSDRVTTTDSSTSKSSSRSASSGVPSGWPSRRQASESSATSTMRSWPRPS